MPLIRHSKYRPPFYLANRHLETIVPNAFRKVKKVNYHRERFTTSDDDFLELDWLKGRHDRVAILTHGLEGNSDRRYMRGMARLFFENGWDVLAWNCRSCGGGMNVGIKLYHHGEVDDLGEVVGHVRDSGRYKKIALVGFSMGASMVVKYLSMTPDLPDPVTAAVGISAPCNLRDSARAALKPSNRIYFRKFFGSLFKKLTLKAEKLPELRRNLKKIKDFDDIHRYYTSVVYGFKDESEVYYHGSLENFLDPLKKPALIINAKNDPIIPSSCSPVEIAANHPYLFLEMPERGGHVGFALAGEEFTWAEWRTLEFLSEVS